MRRSTRTDRVQSDPYWHLTPPSSTLLRLVHYLTSSSPTSVRSLPVLDVGCGFGRNAVALALRGLDVVCADSDPSRLATLTNLEPTFFAQHRLPAQEPGAIRTICADLSVSNWPFGRDAFSSIVCVHFPNLGLLDAFRASIACGGFLYLETFGGQGENYLGLPCSGYLRRVLEKEYDLVFYCEKSIGPPARRRVSAKLLARRL